MAGNGTTELLTTLRMYKNIITGKHIILERGDLTKEKEINELLPTAQLYVPKPALTDSAKIVREPKLCKCTLHRE